MNLAIATPSENHKHLKLIEDVLLVFILVYATSFQNDWWHIKFILITVLLLLQFTNNRNKFPLIFWGLAVLLTSLDLFNYYFVIANHTFVLIYVTALIFVSYIYPDDRIRIVKINSLSIVLVIMFLGASQKAFTPEFMSGDYISSLALQGNLFKPLQIAELVPDVFVKNVALIKESAEGSPHKQSVVQLQTPFKNFAAFSLYFSILIVLAEFAMVPILLLKSEKIKHSLILLFLSSLLITRFETGFISLLIILSIAQLPAEEGRIRNLYLALLAACLALILMKIGAK